MREKTNSVTHLIKIVAKEVYDDQLDKIFERIEKLESSAHVHLFQPTFSPETIKSRAGEAWTEDEERALDDELTRALEWIAQKHGRSSGAIQARISYRGLI